MAVSDRPRDKDRDKSIVFVVNRPYNYEMTTRRNYSFPIHD